MLDTSKHFFQPDEWQNIEIGPNYYISFAVIDNCILYVIIKGSLANANIATYNLLREQFINKYLKNKTAFVEIHKYNSVKGRPNKSNRTLQKNQYFADKGRILATISINTPTRLKFIYQLALKIYDPPFPFLFLNSLEQAIKEAHQILYKHGQSNITTNPDWVYKSNNWKSDIKIIANNILYITSSGHLKHTDIKPMIAIQKKVYDSGLLNNANYYRISNVINTHVRDWRTRRAYSQQMWQYLNGNNILPQTIIFIGGSTLYKFAIKAFQYFVKKNIYFVNNDQEAFDLIYTFEKQDLATNDNTPHTDDEINKLVSTIARLSWDEVNQDLFPINPNDKYSEVYDALNLLKHDIDSLLNERNQAQKALLESAHKAGMAEISTGILHNIGNILNTTSTCFYQIKQSINACPAEQVRKLSDLIIANQQNINDFLTNDKRGKKIPDFIIAMAHTFESLKIEQLQLIQRADKSIYMIKEAIYSQQDYAKGGYFTETVNLAEETQKVLALMKTDLQQYKVTVETHFEKNVIAKCHRSKLAHIITNIIKNAYEAMSTTPKDNIIEIEIKYIDNKKPIIKISDNGPGIPEIYLAKIFTYGFTTKQSGHGFGLHHSANAMTEMGGNLQASNHINGATFTISFTDNSNHNEATVNKNIN